MTVELISRLTCPKCGYVANETIPANACVCIYECRNLRRAPEAKKRRLLRLLLLRDGAMSAGSENPARRVFD